MRYGTPYELTSFCFFISVCIFIIIDFVRLSFVFPNLCIYLFCVLSKHLIMAGFAPFVRDVPAFIFFAIVR